MSKQLSEKSSKEQPSFNFEKALEELNTLVEKMEKGDLSLEESLKEFERGIKLTQDCQKALTKAEQKVKKLVEKGDDLSLEDFQAE